MIQQYKVFLLFTILLITSNLIFTSCSNPENHIKLKGTIAEYEAQITLQNNGSKFKGEFTYLNLDRPKIKLEGVLEGNELRLSEFDKEGELTGIFNGKFDFETYQGNWFFPGEEKKVPFLFETFKRDEKKEAAQKQSVKTKFFKQIEPKELIEFFFEPQSVVKSTIAQYEKEGNEFEVEYIKTEYLEGKKGSFALIFFGNYETYNGYRQDCHACSGFVSIARLKKQKEGWSLVDFVENCECVYGSWGEIHIPKLKVIEGYYFIESEGGYLAQGYYSSIWSLINTETYEVALSVITSESNGGAVGEDSNELFSYGTKIEYRKIKGKLAVILKKEGTMQDKKTNKVVDVTGEEIYIYNEKKLIFEKK